MGLDKNIESAEGSPIKLSLVVPVFNEQGVIQYFLESVDEIFTKSNTLSLEIIFINDGSVDATLDELIEFQSRDSRVVVVDLSRNFGKEAALTAGLQIATGDVVVPIDVDLQDPLEMIHDMIALWKCGYEVVLARRSNRQSDTLLKRWTAGLFYKLHNKISTPKIPENVGDFRLMDRKVVEALKELPESNRFMKGLFAWVGFKTASIEYVRPKRIAGATKFNGWKLWNFAIEGVTSFSTDPLRVWTYFGALISLTSFIFAVFIISKVLYFGVDMPGYASIVVSVTFLGGMQLIGIGILGEYLGRTYIESKNRPIYLIRNIFKS